jgi:hypothetical protein
MTVAIIILLLALAFLAPKFGVDSRDSHDWSSSGPPDWRH